MKKITTSLINRIGKNIKNSSIEDLNKILIQIKDVKKVYVSLDMQDQSKILWCYESVVEILINYALIFELFKQKEFYKAWCKLEQIEIYIKGLKKHVDISNNPFNMLFIERAIKDIQTLFPYRVFVSHESVYREKRCSVCDGKVSARKSCGHKKGEIYNGEICVHKIIRADLLAVAYTDNPVHKYAVCFFSSSKDGPFVDNYDYALIEEFYNLINSPNDNWIIETQILRLPHYDFKEVLHTDECPCGSRKTYDECCLREGGIKHIRYNVTKYYD